MFGGLAPQSDFRTVDAKHSWIATWRAAGRRNQMTGDETEFHQPASRLVWKFQVLQNRLFALAEFGQRSGRPVLATQLQHEFSIARRNGVSQRWVLDGEWRRRESIPWPT